MQRADGHQRSCAAPPFAGVHLDRSLTGRRAEPDARRHRRAAGERAGGERERRTAAEVHVLPREAEGRRRAVAGHRRDAGAAADERLDVPREPGAVAPEPAERRTQEDPFGGHERGAVAAVERHVLQ